MVGPRRRALKALAEEYGGFDLRVFGSVARGEARPDSDVDLLVRFRSPVGLLRRSELRERVETLLGRKVDLATEANLHWLVRPRVVAEAVPL
ncbi:MAG: nucleotidyltransferase family protein [Thermoplasmata archaeon]